MANTGPATPISGLAKVYIIIRREYLERVRTKGFVIGTILGPALLGALMFVPVLLARIAPDTPLKIVVVDRTGAIYADLDAALASDPNQDFMKAPRRGGAAGKVRRYQLEPAPGGEDAAVEEALGRRVRDKEIDAYLVVPADALTGSESEPTYYGRTVSEIVSLRRIENVLTDIIVAKRLSVRGIDTPDVKQLTRRVDLQTIKIGAQGQKKSTGFGEEYLVTMLFVMFLYVSLILYGSALARSLIEEKMNRVVEVLLSSVTPSQLMAGKILGVGSVGLTQFLVWALAGAAFSLYSGSQSPESASLPALDPVTLVFFVVFFVLGYFIYASLFCIVGATCTSEQEAQNAQTPVTMLLVIPMIFAVALVRQPGGTIATVLSHVPFFSPIVMLMRVNLLRPPAWELAVNLVAIVVTIALLVWAAGKVFRVGILMTGKRATIPEIVRWMRAA